MRSHLRFIRSWKLIICLVIMPFIFLSSLLASSHRHKAQKLQSDEGEGKPIQVVIQQQDNAPLTIRFKNVDSTDPTEPVVYLNIHNVSNRPVRAYAIRSDVDWGSSKSSSISLNNITSLEHLLNPQQPREEVINDFRYTKPVRGITLSLDFIEFLDGARWGADTFKSGEQLDGLRAGARAETNALLEMLKASGPQYVANKLDSENAEVTIPSEESSAYLSGYRAGIDSIRERLRHAKKNGELRNVEKELQRPIDLSDQR